MAHHHKVALERIVALCEKSTYPTKRVEQIYDIALGALGMTANQREFEIRRMREGALQRQRNLMALKKASKNERHTANVE